MKKTLEDIREDFTKVITYKIITTIKNHYGTLEDYKREYANGGNRALARYIANFHFDARVLQALTRHDGKRHLHQILQMLDYSRLRYKGKCNKTYASGKSFAKLSTLYIPFQELERLFSLADAPDSPFRTDSAYYTKEQHKLIDKHILHYGKKRKQTTPQNMEIQEMRQNTIQPSQDDDLILDVPPQSCKPQKRVTPQTQESIMQCSSSKVIPRLQEFIDRRLIMSGEAKLMLKCYDVVDYPVTIASRRNELILQDVSSMPDDDLRARGIIIKTFCKEIDGKPLSTAQKKTVCAFISKLQDVVDCIKARRAAI